MEENPGRESSRRLSSAITRLQRLGYRFPPEFLRLSDRDKAQNLMANACDFTVEVRNPGSRTWLALMTTNSGKLAAETAQKCANVPNNGVRIIVQPLGRG